MEKHLLSKSTFIRAFQCEKALYLHKKRPFLRDKLSAEQRAKFDRGTHVGEIARELFPGGINLAPKGPSQYQPAVSKTAKAIEEGQEVIPVRNKGDSATRRAKPAARTACLPQLLS